MINCLGCGGLALVLLVSFKLFGNYTNLKQHIHHHIYTMAIGITHLLTMVKSSNGFFFFFNHSVKGDSSLALASLFNHSVKGGFQGFRVSLAFRTRRNWPCCARARARERETEESAENCSKWEHWVCLFCCSSIIYLLLLLPFHVFHLLKDRHVGGGFSWEEEVRGDQ